MPDITTSDHSDDRETITIPEIEISDNWYVSELTTVAECDEALAVLNEAVFRIEHQLRMEDIGGPRAKGAAWVVGAKTSLSWKKYARDVVGEKRQCLADDASRLFSWILINKPEWVTTARQEMKQ